MFISTLRILCITLLLQACASTSGPATSDAQPATQSAVTANKAGPKAAIANIPVSGNNEAAVLPFNGPQVVFTPGSDEIPRTAAPIIEDVAAKLKADPLVNVVLIGRTEDMGSTEFSVAVASKCAQAVSQALIKRGARPRQIRLLARGYEKTTKYCTTVTCRKSQRRVDIVMSEY